jgi:hypothetical protein
MLAIVEQQQFGLFLEGVNCRAKQILAIRSHAQSGDDR